MPGGRPSCYNESITEEICLRLAKGESLRSICKDEHLPEISTVLRWVVDGKHPEFFKQYDEARQAQAEYLADELRDIADDGSNDYMERNNPNNPGWVENGEAIGRSRLRVDTRKWIASKLLSKRYGEKTETVHTGDPAHPIVISEMAGNW
jgi:Bacteriophage Sf6, terminase small subunit-like